MSKEMENEGFELFCDALLEVWRLSALNGRVPATEWRTIEARFAGESYKFSEVVAHDFQSAYMPSQELLRKNGIAALPKLRACAVWHVARKIPTLVASDDSGKPVDPDELTVVSWYGFSVLSMILRDILKETQGGQPDEEIIRRAYIDNLKRITGELPSSHVYVPIHGLKLPSEELTRISDKLRLSTLTDREKNAGWFQTWMSRVSTNASDLCACTSVLVEDQYAGSGQLDELGMFLTALRLQAVDQFVAPDQFKEIVGSSVVQSALGQLKDFGSIRRPNLRPARHLTVQEFERARESFAQLRRIANAGHLDRIATALSRFNKSFVGSSVEEQLVDTVIAIESVVLPSEKDSELSYRFRLNATLLSVDELGVERTAEMLQLFKKLYAIRSSIVHKGKHVHGLKDWQKCATSLDEFIAKAQEGSSAIMRRVLKFLDEGTFDKLGEHLERRSVGLA